MVINCYLATPSYQDIELGALETNIKEMCSLMSTHIPEENFFFDIDKFYNVRMKSGKLIYDGLFDIPDQQFVNQILMVELEKFRTLNTAPKAKSEYYCYWGYYFQPRKEYEFSCVADYLAYRYTCIDEAISTANFWNLKKYLFPTLIFADSVKDNIEELSSDWFNVIKDGLARFEKLALCWQRGEKDILDGFRDFGKNFSGESEQTRKDDKLMQKRDFVFAGRGTIRCEKHLKLAYQLRIHINWEYDKRNILIGYAGEHLPIASERH